MANTLKNTAQVIVNKVLMEFKNSSGLSRFVDRSFEKKFGKEGAKIGSSLEVLDQVLAPSSGTGSAVTPASITERTRILTLNQRLNQSWAYTVDEDALSVDQWMERHGKPHGQRLANDWDLYLMKLAYQSTGLYIGTPAVAVDAFKKFGQARAQIDRFAPPPGDKILIMDPDTQVEAIDLSKGLFHPTDIEGQYKEGNMTKVAGFKPHMSQNVRRHTVGPLGGTPLVKGANQTGTSITTDGWTASAANRLKTGDSIRFLSASGSLTGAVYGVNPITKEILPEPRAFVVKADADSDASGNLTVTIDPPIATSGVYQTVDIVPADNAVIQIFQHANSYANKISAENLALHPAAITAAVFPLPVPEDSILGATAYDDDMGIGLSLWRASDIRTGEIITRLDLLAGAVVRHPEWICRILGA